MNPTDVNILAPQGRLDAAAARPFEDVWKQHVAEGRYQILVDLKDIHYISSNGLRTLLNAARTSRKHGGADKLCCLSPRLFEILEMAGFDRVFEIFPDREQALASFA